LGKIQEKKKKWRDTEALPSLGEKIKKKINRGADIKREKL